MRIKSRRKTIIASNTRNSKQGKFSGGIVTPPITRVVLNNWFALQNSFKSSIFLQFESKEKLLSFSPPAATGPRATITGLINNQQHRWSGGKR